MAVECVVLISATAEWDAVRDCFPAARCAPSPYGDWFADEMKIHDETRRVVLFHGGWGKVAAAGSTQYAVGRWAPRSIVNLGTCGGFLEHFFVTGNHLMGHRRSFGKARCAARC